MDPMVGHLAVDKSSSHYSQSITDPESQTEPTSTLSSMETAIYATSYLMIQHHKFSIHLRPTFGIRQCKHILFGR